MNSIKFDAEVYLISNVIFSVKITRAQFVAVVDVENTLTRKTRLVCPQTCV